MIEPAFSAEGWALGLPDQLDGYVDWDMGTVDVTLGGPGGQTRDIHKDRHRLAALALYGQPFGFTRGDVEVLRQKAVWGGPQGEAPDSLADRIEAFWEALDSLADRIESLLPPEKE